MFSGAKVRIIINKTFKSVPLPALLTAL